MAEKKRATNRLDTARLQGQTDTRALSRGGGMPPAIHNGIPAAKSQRPVARPQDRQSLPPGNLTQHIQQKSNGYRPPHARPPIASPHTSALASTTIPPASAGAISPFPNVRASTQSLGRLLLSVNRVNNNTPNRDESKVEDRVPSIRAPKIKTRVPLKHTSATVHMETIFLEQQNERLAKEKEQEEKNKAAKKRAERVEKPSIKKERKADEAKRTEGEQSIGGAAEHKPSEEIKQKPQKKRSSKQKAKPKVGQEAEVKEAASQKNEVSLPKDENACKLNEEEERKAQEQKELRLAERRARRAAARKARKAAARKEKEEAAAKEVDNPKGVVGEVAQATTLKLAEAEPKSKAKVIVIGKAPGHVQQLKLPTSSASFNLATRKSALPTKAKHDGPSPPVRFTTASNYLAPQGWKPQKKPEGHLDLEEWSGRARGKGMNKSMHKARTWIM